MAAVPKGLLAPIAVCLAVFGGPGGAWSASPPAQDASRYLAPLLAIAEARNPELAASRQKVEQARARAGYAGRLEAPKLTLTVMDVPTFGAPAIAISQLFPGGDKRALAEDAARYEAGAAQFELASQRIALRGEVEQDFYELATQSRMLAVHDEIHRQLMALQRITTSRYAVGSGMQADIIRVQIEVAKLHKTLFGIQRDFELARTRLNTRLNRPHGTAIAVPSVLPRPAPPPRETRLRQALDRTHPDLLASAARIASARSRLALARMQQGTPDVGLTFQVGRDMSSGAREIGGSVGFDLPWLARQSLEGRVGEGQSELASLEASREATRNQLHLRLHEAYTDVIQADRQLLLYRTAVFPLLRQGVNTALAAYAVNKLDFTSVMASQTDYVTAQMDDARTLGDRYKAMGRLLATAGYPSLSSTERGPR